MLLIYISSVHTTLCLKHEGELDTDDEIRRIRILDFVLLEAPKREIRAYFAESIYNCENEPEILVELVSLFAYHHICFCSSVKKDKSLLPATTSYPSRRSVEDHWKEVKANIAQAPKNYEDAKYHAFIRDSWTCLGTGVVDDDVLEDIFNELDPTHIAFLECAHIIPGATCFYVKDKPRGISSDAILTVLKLFSCDISSFNGEMVRSLVNVITMTKDMHKFFDRLKLYFEATSTANRYEVKYYTRGKPHQRMSDFVTFSTRDPEHLPVPSHKLLTLHATCCKVTHTSGTTEYIDKVYDDVDETGVLAFDSTSGGIHSYELLSLANSSGFSCHDDDIGGTDSVGMYIGLCLDLIGMPENSVGLLYHLASKGNTGVAYTFGGQSCGTISSG
ncbi:hypothetical protein NP233_g232 [Leucocoprinus birnbaumii]|uniref:HNH nuclease domain-containing protein n=1 Tax=Leucocoprinus birnbaumii TaxID=56174 RepID=A0AAD5W298_9AGAR|nr:hypothetical protein NP233_g232 [Leucocoprinus birnbaumii]